MLAEAASVFSPFSNSLAVLIVTVFVAELCSYGKLMNKRQKILNVLVIPAMALFAFAWPPANADIVRFIIALLAWGGSLIDICHLPKEEKGWVSTNVLEFVLLCVLLAGTGAVLSV